MLVRCDTWRTRLSAYLDEVRERPFLWGHHDCALFAAGAVEAMTGVDPADGWRGRYRTPAGALRVVRKAGHPDLGALVSRFLQPVAPALAAVGDIALLAGPTPLEGLGIVTGSLIAAPTAGGIGFAPRDAMIAAFHLPFAGEVG